MPTGYTADVSNGKIADFRTFALQCARNFGALITMRDEPMEAPIPDEFKPSPFYAERVEKLGAEIDSLEAMEPEALAHAEEEDFLERVARWRERREERRATRERYEDMLAAARAWTPPTPDHQGLKDFMVQQLTESLRFDCNDSYDREPPESLDPELWRAQKLASARDELTRARQSLDEERARVANRNEWVRQLRESLTS